MLVSDPVDVAYFRRVEAAGSEILLPEPPARALWAGGRQMRGSAVSGALARQAERSLVARGVAGLRPARLSLDLFRPAAMAECVTSGRVVRAGRRICLVDAVLRQGDVEVARASALFLAGGETDNGPVWTPERPVEPPPPDVRPETTEPRLYRTAAAGRWTGRPRDHRGGSRTRAWVFGVPVVVDESPSPFQLAAMAGDVGNIVTNWGVGGLAHINADLTVRLARLPAGEEIGISAELRLEHEGLVASEAVLSDRGGAFGTASLSALPSPTGAIDPRELGDPL